tara:strand:+ start:161 stop:514 length:354 start_codon:yes stop_codon:yes gene_type:complete
MISFRDFQEGKSARSRLLGRLKSKGVDLDKIAKDRKAEYERLKKKYKYNEDTIDEAPLVMDDGDILDSIWKKVKPELVKDMKKGKLEFVNNLARIGKYKVTKDKQQKGRTFRYDLKK